SPVIRALGTDARVARLEVGKAPVYPTPADPRASQFALVHGAVARDNAARCATCHTRASCEACHTGEGALSILRQLPDAREATAPGVQLRQPTRMVQVQTRQTDTTTHIVSVHPAGFA